MKFLKGVLVTLVILFVLILGVGAYLFGYNQSRNSAAQGHPPTEEPPGHSEPAKEKLIPVIVGREQISPEEYLRDMQEALQLVREATGLITSEAYMATPPFPGTDTQGSPAQPGIEGMSKVHQGIYKMAQGITVLDIKMKDMGEEIKRAREDKISYYEIPGQTRDKLYVPYNPYNPYNPYYGGTWNAPNAYGQQPGPGSNAHTSPAQGHTASQFGQGLTSIFSANSLVYVLYAILILSVIAGVVGVAGFLGSLLKPPSQRHDPYAG